jgi:hypothetical protein
MSDCDLPVESANASRYSAFKVLHIHSICKSAGLLLFILFLCGNSAAQAPYPFQVVNPQKKQWSPDEAYRIYTAACELVARKVRPEQPPQLRPHFLLVLGAHENEIVRNGAVSEIHLRTWDSGRFAEAAVIMAAREIVKGEDVSGLARDVLMTADASVTVNELQQDK